MPTKSLNQLASVFGILPIIVGVLSFVITAGVTYGVLGSTVENNTEDIKALQKAQEINIEIRADQAAARVEREKMSKDIDRILNILEARR